MNFQVIGVSHHTAPVEVREQLAIPDERLDAAVRELVQQPGVNECLIVSTCNRVELLADVSDPSVDLQLLLGVIHRRDLSPLATHFYQWRERQAIRHVFRVASSLDSLVVGEPQILGQMKQAYRVAREAGAARANLHALISRAFVVANVCDAGSARVLAGLGFAALATSSGASAWAYGTRDGRITCDQAHARAIVDATDLPVSADLERGFGATANDVAETYRHAAAVGLVGATIEDATPASRKDKPLFEHRRGDRARRRRRGSDAQAPISVHAHRARRRLPARQHRS